MNTKNILPALATIAALATGCAVQAQDEGAAGGADESSITAAPSPGSTVPIQGPVQLCLAVPPPNVTGPFYLPGGLGGWAGTESESTTTYGNRCTPYYVVETTGTHGRGGIELAASAQVDAAMSSDAFDCELSTITVEAWGCTALNASGACSQWSHLGKSTAHGVWTPEETSGSFHFGPTCGLGASRPTTGANSPYYALRVGAAASRQIFAPNGTVISVPLAVDEHAGFYQIN